MESSHPYDSLSPEVVLGAIEATGFSTTARFSELNSYENRVYQIEKEDGDFLVAKFYRPTRWSTEQILEEHAFSKELLAEEIPIVAPIEIAGETLFEHEGFRYAIFDRQGGHTPNLEDMDNLSVLARTLARIHTVGSRQAFEYRPRLTAQSYGSESRQFLLDNQWIPIHLERTYAELSESLIELCAARTDHLPVLRSHGDCHPGNILWRVDTPHFVDFDDCLSAPAIQDLWMLAGASDDTAEYRWSIIESGYAMFAELPVGSRLAVEALRTLRMMRHTAWIARRWDDSAFPRAFAHFDGNAYWEDHVASLQAQQMLLTE